MPCNLRQATLWNHNSRKLQYRILVHFKISKATVLILISQFQLQVPNSCNSISFHHFYGFEFSCTQSH
ncbi:hypothetical protein P8452_00210 [Trifolium repens]|nr:hypothetical protein P8452_00210 [Trifolium repens]